MQDDGTKGRFVIYEEDTKAGEMTFTWAGDTSFIIDHTEVDPEFGGKGYAAKLVEAGVDYARQRQVKIIPLCPYAGAQFKRHEEYQDVKA